MIHEQAAAFVLDALDRDEEIEFERHLEICPACEDDLEPLRLAAVALAFNVDLPQPRPELRARVMHTGAPVIALRSRLRPHLVPAAAVLAACAAIVVGLRPWHDGGSIGGMHRFTAQGSAGTLLVGRSGEAVLVVPDLAPAPAGKVYEIWVMAGSRVTAAGVLRGSVAALTQPVRPGTAVAVSAEPLGGSRRPTGPLLLRAATT